MEREATTSFETRRLEDWTVLNINVTWFCPVKCEYCHITSKGSHKDRRILSLQDLARECEVGRSYGIDEYRFSGGEPLSLGDRLFEYADVVRDITGKKPAVLTSGIYLNKNWLHKARGKFSGIYISIENPFEPLQHVVDPIKMMELIRGNFTEDLPLRYGLTLVTASQFANIKRIFNTYYDNVNRSFMPQLEYPSLKNFILPSEEELKNIYSETKWVFREFGAIPYYFVNVIGPIAALSNNSYRVVANLNPDGRYDIYSSMREAFETKYKWIEYSKIRQQESETCQSCDWIQCCRHHGGDLMYDWCNLRKAIFQGIYDGLKTA